MCRNIKVLFNFDPPARDKEMHEAALQFVRKISGSHHPSQANEAAFDQAVHETEVVIKRLLSSLTTQAEPRNREEEAVKAHARALARFGK